MMKARSPLPWLLLAIPAVLLASCESPGSIPSPDALRAMDALERTALAISRLTIPAAGDVLIIGGGAGSQKHGKSTVASEAFGDNTGKFSLTGPLQASRMAMQAVAFTGGPLAGKVLVLGGLSGRVSATGRGFNVGAASLGSAELFDPSSGKFSLLANQMNEPRSFFTATALNDGTVLIAGGFDPFGTPVASAEIFDPSTEIFTPLSNQMTSPRALQSATLLPDGTVLLAGGIADTSGTTSGTAEIYDPTTKSFTETTGALPNSLIVAGQTATLIAGCSCADDGKVLIAGGFGGSGVSFGWAMETTENELVLYDPSTQTFATAGQLADDRAGHTATLLPDGRVLLAGGVHGQSAFGQKDFGIYGGVLDSAEIFDPTTGETSCVNGTRKNGSCKPAMVNSRVGHTATLLPAGKFAGDVLLAGGVGGKTETVKGRGEPLKTAELFVPAKSKFVRAGEMKSAHSFGAAVVVP